MISPEEQAQLARPSEQTLDQEMMEANPFQSRMGEPEDVAMLGGLGGKIANRFRGMLRGGGDEVPAPAPRAEEPTIDVNMQERPTELGLEDIQNLGDPDGQGRTYERNVNSNLFEDDETKAVLELFSKEQAGYNDIPQRKVQTHEETIALAQTQQSLERVVSGKVNQKWGPEDLVNAYTLLDNMAKELRHHAKDIGARQEAGIEITAQELLQFDGKLARFNGLQEIAAGRAAEAGRMLNSLRSINRAVSGGPKGLAEITRLTDSVGGKDTLLARINLIANTDNLADTAGSARKAFLNKTADALMSWRYNAMLSSIRTHVANISGSVLTGAWEMALVNPTKIGINNLEWVMRRSLGDRNATRVPFSDVVTRPYFHLKAVKSALITAKKVFSGEQLGEGKLYQDSGLNYQPSNRNPIEVPGRMLEAEDAFFKSMYQQAFIEDWAYKRAQSLGGDESTYNQNFQTFISSPPKEVIEQATEYAGKQTFTNDPSHYGAIVGTLAKMGMAVQNAGGGRVGRLILPFVRTPANLLGYASEQATGGLVSPTSFWHKVASQDPEIRADAIARFTIASGLFTLMKEYYEDGTITGAAPGNYNEYKVRESAGWRPSALRVGDEYWELNRSEPLGLIFGMIASTYDVANYAKTDDESFEMVMNSTGAVAKLLADRSFLSGLSDFLDVISSMKDGTSASQSIKFGSNMISSFVTAGIIRDAREFTDEYRRDMSFNTDWDGAVNRMGKQFKNAFPGWSQDLPPSVDVFGDYIKSSGGKYWRALVPIRTAQIEQDDAAAALIVSRIPVTKPNHIINPPGFGPKINLLDVDNGKGWVYHEYQKMVGKQRRLAVEEIVKRPEWKTAVENGDIGPDTASSDFIRRQLQKAMKAANAEFLDWLAGRTEVVPTVAGEETGEPIKFDAVLTAEQYSLIKENMKASRVGGEVDQKVIDEAKEGFYEIDETKELKGLAPEFTPRF